MGQMPNYDKSGQHTYAVVSEQEWDQGRSMRSTWLRRSPWTRLVDALERGEIVLVPFADADTRRRGTIGIDSAARRRGFQVDKRDTTEGRMFKKRHA